MGRDPKHDYRSRCIYHITIGKAPTCPAFIICGFPHCVADSFYYVSCSREFVEANDLSLLAAYLPTVLGNYLGCNAYRLTIGMPAWFTPLTDETASTKASEDAETTASANSTVNADNPNLADQ